MENFLKGKIALVTGGSSGLGFAAAELLAQHGAHVYITGRRADALEAAKKRIGKNISAISADVTSLTEMKQVQEIIKGAHGSLDIIFANAGGGKYKELDQITEEFYNQTFDVNVKGTLFTVQAMLPILNNGSSIIINSSITADMGLPAFSMYAATKAAVRSFAKSWSSDLKDRGIRVNSLSPGTVPTEGYEHEIGMTPQQVDDYIARVTPSIPLGRVGTPREVAEALLFLASDRSSFITGIDLVVDGGQTQIYAGRN
ncbi:SDR family oxidoreductase [Sphingobacterium sp. MYb388]|uniref:SDR family oxidoreductase n=1 Tax=Sphingobacterium sp. MYb388 TaxID=2745437 RepID=UPI0030B3F2DF